MRDSEWYEKDCKTRVKSANNGTMKRVVGV